MKRLTDCDKQRRQVEECASRDRADMVRAIGEIIDPLVNPIGGELHH